MDSPLNATKAALTGNGPYRSERKPIRSDLPAGALRQLEKSLKKQWKRYRKQLKSCQGQSSEKAIHDSRVEARRLISILELLAGFMAPDRVKKVERELKRHLDRFDDLRDTQVQLSIVGKLQKSFPAARSFHAYLLKREGRFARQTRKRIKDIKTRRLAKLVSTCRAEVEHEQRECSPQRASELLLRSVNRAFSRTVYLASRIDPHDTKTIHCTRVAFKRYRYMVEALADYLPGVDERLLERLHDYQSLMGDIQDSEVLRLTLDKFLGKKNVRAATVREFREELLRRRLWLIRKYLEAAGELLDFWPLIGAHVNAANASRPALARLRRLARHLRQRQTPQPRRGRSPRNLK